MQKFKLSNLESYLFYDGVAVMKLIVDYGKNTILVELVSKNIIDDNFISQVTSFGHELLKEYYKEKIKVFEISN